MATRTASACMLLTLGAPGGVFVALPEDKGTVGVFERPASDGATATPPGAHSIYVVGGAQATKRIVLR